MINESLAQDAVGGVLSFLRTQLGGDNFSKIVEAIPGADSLAMDTETKSRSAGGEAGEVSLLIS